MSRDLKKFVNPRFTATVDLALMRMLFERHQDEEHSLGLAVFEQGGKDARYALQAFFAGPEDTYPPKLVADLHQISELGNSAGLELLIEQAGRMGVTLDPLWSGSPDGSRQDPKHVALYIFLHHPDVLTGAIAIQAFRTVSACAEFAGSEEGVEADIGEQALAAFEAAAREIFAVNLRGRYCSARCYDDDGELNVVVTHGAPFTTTGTLEGGQERVISFRAATHAVLSYSPITGRLKIARIPKGQQQAIAEAFAAELLKRPGFFEGPDAQNLYTLAHVERSSFGFAFQHAFEPKIRRVDIVEAQADRIEGDPKTGKPRVFWSLLARDPRGNALAHIGRTREVTLGSNDWRLNHLVVRVSIDEEPGRKPKKVTVKIKPPGAPAFPRQRYEQLIMTLLRRNGIAHDRNFGRAAAAAE